MKNDPRKYEMPIEKVRPFEKQLMVMEGRLLDEKIFQVRLFRCCVGSSDPILSPPPKQKN